VYKDNKKKLETGCYFLKKILSISRLLAFLTAFYRCFIFLVLFSELFMKKQPDGFSCLFSAFLHLFYLVENGSNPVFHIIIDEKIKSGILRSKVRQTD
jgi:hypothetical protein